MPLDITPFIKKKNAYASLPAYQKVDIQNQNALERLKEEGLLEDFLKYQKSPSMLSSVGKGLASAGSGVMDVLQRPMYATTAGLNQVWGGEPGVSGQELGNAIIAGGKELLSGIGGIQGTKETPGELFRAKSPGYAQFSQAHPYQSIATDFALSLGLDPTVVFGAPLYKGAAKALTPVGKAMGAGAKAFGATKFGSALGEAFIPGFKIKQVEGGSAVYEIMQNENRLRGFVSQKTHEAMRPLYNQLVGDYTEDTYALMKIINGEGIPESINALSRPQRIAAQAEIARKALGDDAADAVLANEAVLRQGKREALILKKDPNGVLKLYYAPNDAKAAAKYADELGIKPTPFRASGYGGGAKLKEGLQQFKGKVFQTIDEQNDWLMNVVGIPQEELGRVRIAIYNARIGKGLQSIRNVRIIDSAFRKLGTKYTAPDGFVGLREQVDKHVLDTLTQQGITGKKAGLQLSAMKKSGQIAMTDEGVLRDLPFGTKFALAVDKVTGEPLLRPGEVLFVKGGNLRMFPVEVQKVLPDDIMNILESGGEVSDTMYGRIMDAVNKAEKVTTTQTMGTVADLIGPAKKVEDVITGALTARGMTAGEAGVYIKKLRSASGVGDITKITETTGIDKKKLGLYLKSLIRETETNSFKIDEDLYDNISNLLAGKTKTMIGITTRVPVYAVPKAIAEELAKVPRNLADEISLLRYVDSFNSAFKNTAIFSTYFLARNAMTNAFDLYLYGKMSPEYLRGAEKYIMAGLGGKTKGVSIYGLPYEAWEKQIRVHGAFGGFSTGQVEALSNRGKNAIVGGIDKAFAVNRKINSVNEQYFRTALFMNESMRGVAVGHTPTEKDFVRAATVVKKYLFDYDELTDVERNIMKRIVPFYKWARGNIPLMISQIFENPGKFRNVEKLKMAIAGDDQSKYNPDWWKDQDVWTIKNTKLAYQVGLPYADLNMFGGTPTGQLGLVGSAINFAQNYDPFRERQITEFPGQTEALLAGKWVRVPPKAKYALESALPIVKRYGTDLSEQLYNIFTGNDPDGINKLKQYKNFLGVAILPQITDQQEKTRVYNLQEELSNYQSFLEQRATQKNP